MDTPKTLAARLAEWVVDYAYHPSRPGDTRAIVEVELRADFPEIDRLSAPDVGVGLTRYTPEVDGIMERNPEGEWIRHKDVAQLLAAARAVPADVELETTAEERAEIDHYAQTVSVCFPEDERAASLPGRIRATIRDVNTLTAALAASTAREKAKDEEIAGREPDYWYHVDDWENTAPWADLREAQPDPGEVLEIATLLDGPKYFVIWSVEKSDVQAFRSEKEARAALSGRKPDKEGT